MGDHALLSASASKRWMNCTPSARLEEGFPKEESTFAAEGTAAHELAEYYLRKYLGEKVVKPMSDFHSKDMEVYIQEYVDYAVERIEAARERCRDTKVFIEQRLDYSGYAEGGFGTGDLILVGDKALEIIDLKYGKGVKVEARENSQLMLYALGALELFEILYDIEKITMTIHQPRVEGINSWEVTTDELKLWAKDELVPKARLGAKGEGEFKPGSWCNFCRARKAISAKIGM